MRKKQLQSENRLLNVNFPKSRNSVLEDISSCQKAVLPSAHEINVSRRHKYERCINFWKVGP